MYVSGLVVKTSGGRTTFCTLLSMHLKALEGGSRQFLKAVLEVSQIITGEEMMDGKRTVSQDHNLAAKCRISWHVRTEFLELCEVHDIKDDLLVCSLSGEGLLPKRTAFRPLKTKTDMQYI